MSARCSSGTLPWTRTRSWHSSEMWFACTLLLSPLALQGHYLHAATLTAKRPEPVLQQAGTPVVPSTGLARHYAGTDSLLLIGILRQLCSLWFQCCLQQQMYPLHGVCFASTAPLKRSCFAGSPVTEDFTAEAEAET